MSDDEMIRTLAALTPTRAADATAVAFEACRRSARASIVRWRLATATAIAFASAALPLRTRSEPAMLAAAEPPRSIEATPPPIAPLPPDNVIALRDAVLAHGLDGLPPLPPRGTARLTSVRDLIGGDL